MPSRTYRALEQFIRHTMRMSHVYQPLVILELLERGGTATDRELAERLLRADEGQLEYYEQVLRKMPARVLRSHRVIAQTLDGWELVGWELMTAAERRALRSACEERLDRFRERRGSGVWDSRRRNTKGISGTIRYEVLSRARTRCELCGISADLRGLHVDHIIPRSLGGSNDVANLQALCWRCNENKGNRDSTDFRGLLTQSDTTDAACAFCFPTGEVVAETALARAIRDRFPVTPLHTLLIPRRHVHSWGDLRPAEVAAIDFLMREVREGISTGDPQVRAFNIGINDGEAAGQTIPHAHLHLIPRRHGDIADPTGGVRGVIPERRRY